ncbi:SOS response-associated peptidase family protein [Streptomyces sp. NPDC059740]|uniref:SOS response-associated peptidase family protein n=1 Tax=Streptomyces sp. NPDC059740 TaxID=3346926 RepID=UPI003662356D
MPAAADGFYEWVTVEATKMTRAHSQPYFISPEDGQVMAFAGLRERRRDRSVPEGHPAAWLTSCTLITAEATDAAVRVHPRKQRGPPTAGGR